MNVVLQFHQNGKILLYTEYQSKVFKNFAFGYSDKRF